MSELGTTSKHRNPTFQSCGYTRCIGAILLASGLSPAAAQSTPASLGDQVAGHLALGRASGCAGFLGLDDAANRDVADALISLLNSGSIGRELAAICAPSAVASASSLGGALNSVQATKTVSQFRPVRRRIDKRTRPSSGRPATANLTLNFLPSSSDLDANTRPDDEEGLNIFTELEHERRGQDVTRYEQGYDSDINRGSVGFDLAWGRAVAGAWIGYSRTDGKLAGGIDPFPISEFYENPALIQAQGCGGIEAGGAYDGAGGAVGAFAGWRFGRHGYLDIVASRTDQDVNYRRSACVAEFFGSELFFENGRLTDGSRIGGSPINSIFAGEIHGTVRSVEDSVSMRTGYDIGQGDLSFSPRITLTYSRIQTDAYSESGRSTVDYPISLVGEVDRLVIDRTRGEMVGLELSYRNQSRNSLLLEIGGQLDHSLAAFRGRVVVHASAYWRRQLQHTQRHPTVRFAQDYRDEPVYFSFATNEIDESSSLFSAGLTAAIGSRGAVRFEISRLEAEDLISSTSYSVQFRAGL